MQHALDFLYADGQLKSGTLVAINAEKMLTAEDNADVRTLINAAEYKYADGISVVRSVRKKYPQADVSRVAGADLWEALMERAGREGTPVFLVGETGSDGTDGSEAPSAVECESGRHAGRLF